MADTNDTIDGLLAEFRGYAAGMPPSYHVTMSWADFRRMLDRFDAAHKREVDKLNSVIQATVSHSDAEIDRLRREIAEPRRAGSAAKLREAMKCIVAASIVAKNANAPEWILQRMADIFAMATTALAATEKEGGANG